MRGSNPRHHRCKRCALPTELNSQVFNLLTTYLIYYYSIYLFGAGRGNRTLAERLEIFRSTTKLYPRLYIILSKMMLNSAFRVKYNHCRRVETGRQARLRSVWSNPWRFDSSRRHRTFNLFFAKISILLCRSSQDGHGTGLKNLGYWFESNLRHNPDTSGHSRE